MVKKFSVGFFVAVLLTTWVTGCNGYPIDQPSSSAADVSPSYSVPDQVTPQTAPSAIKPSQPENSSPSETLAPPSDAPPKRLEVNSGLPVLYLEFDLAAVYQDQGDYQPGTLNFQLAESDTNETPLLFGPYALEIKGRGNSTWRDDKRSFHLQLDQKLDFFGLGANKHWLLLGQSSDLTLMKNKLFYDLSGELGLVSMQSEWVELVINNQHLGNYLLCEKINHSDNLALPNGLIYELDTNFDEDYRFKTANNQPIMLHTHKYLDELDEPTLIQIQERLQAFESAVTSADFSTQYQGRRVRYTDLVDLDSLVNYWLIQELSFNPSIFKNSTFFYQASIDAPYHMGPVWDMDQSTGDLEFQYPGYDRWGSIMWGNVTTMDTQTRAWHKSFIHDPVFIKAAQQAYWRNHDRFTKLVAENGTLYQMREKLLPSAILNYQIWQNESDAEEAKDDYKVLVKDLKGWLTNRIAWLDLQFQSVQSLTESLN